MIRLNKYLSLSGISSRRGADTLIKEGKITVNDQTVNQVGTVIDETKDIIKVDGVIIEPVGEKVYLILNKPANVMTTLHDPFKRKTIMNYLKNFEHRVYPVGRLDYDTKGVLMLTNDGELAYRLTHPKFQVEKIYEVKVVGKFTKQVAYNICKGIKLEDGHMGKAQKISILQQNKNWSKIRMTMTEGRKREVKQLCKKSGHPVLELTRVEFATLTTYGLTPGRWRNLTASELKILKKMVGLDDEKRS